MPLFFLFQLLILFHLLYNTKIFFIKTLKFLYILQKLVIRYKRTMFYQSHKLDLQIIKLWSIDSCYFCIKLLFIVLILISFNGYNNWTHKNFMNVLWSDSKFWQGFPNSFNQNDGYYKAASRAIHKLKYSLVKELLLSRYFCKGKVIFPLKILSSGIRLDLSFSSFTIS